MNIEAIPNLVERNPILGLPENLRYDYSRLVQFAQINNEGFRMLNEDQMKDPLFPQSDPPIKQLIHITAHTYARVHVLKQAGEKKEGNLRTYDYYQQFPELAALYEMNRFEILRIFVQTIDELYYEMQKPDVTERRIRQPYLNFTISGANLFNEISGHLRQHAQNMIDYYEKFNIPRSDSMKAAFG